MEGFVDSLFAPRVTRRIRGGLRSAGAFFRRGRV
jgi:hypothetical protein